MVTTLQKVASARTLTVSIELTAVGQPGRVRSGRGLPRCSAGHALARGCAMGHDTARRATGAEGEWFIEA